MNENNLKQKLINDFSKYYWDSGVWQKTFWFGTAVRKLPSDLLIYQEILYETKPDLIIECGTDRGGSALFLANILDILGNGRIITIDVVKKERPEHDRITYLTGSSISKEIIDKIKSLIKEKQKVMVILDSNHTKNHVLKELEAYRGFVTVGNYMVVEDSNINGHPVKEDFGPGPFEALTEFLFKNNQFIVDKNREKFFVTFNPSGYLKKISE